MSCKSKCFIITTSSFLSEDDDIDDVVEELAMDDGIITADEVPIIRYFKFIKISIPS